MLWEDQGAFIFKVLMIGAEGRMTQDKEVEDSG